MSPVSLASVSWEVALPAALDMAQRFIRQVAMLNPTGFHRITNRLELRSTAFHTLTRMSCRPVDSEQKTARW